MSGDAVLARFHRVLRLHLTELPSNREIDFELSLRDFGLDSLETVSLIVDLEDEFDILLPDEAMVAATFETAGSLWRALEVALEPTG